MWREMCLPISQIVHFFYGNRIYSLRTLCHIVCWPLSPCFLNLYQDFVLVDIGGHAEFEELTVALVRKLSESGT